MVETYSIGLGLCQVFAFEAATEITDPATRPEGTCPPPPNTATPPHRTCPPHRNHHHTVCESHHEPAPDCAQLPSIHHPPTVCRCSRIASFQVGRWPGHHAQLHPPSTQPRVTYPTPPPHHSTVCDACVWSYLNGLSLRPLQLQLQGATVELMGDHHTHPPHTVHHPTARDSHPRPHPSTAHGPPPDRARPLW